MGVVGFVPTIWMGVHAAQKCGLISLHGAEVADRFDIDVAQAHVSGYRVDVEKRGVGQTSVDASGGRDPGDSADGQVAALLFED